VKVTPKTDKQLKEEMLIPIGEYDFTVADAEEKESAKGNPMIALKLTIHMPSGGERTVRDWLMTSSPSMEYKLRHFCQAIGMGAEYGSGEIHAEDMAHRGGRVIINQKDDEKYGVQNGVKDYVVPEESDAAPAPRPTQPPIVRPVSQAKMVMDESEIPF
jgi:hypothetical protein